MANTDSSSYTVRFNEVTQLLEYAVGSSWVSIPAVVGGITQLTGDITAGPGTGSQPATLANTTVTPGSYTSANITVDAKGRITTAANGSSGPSFTPAFFAFLTNNGGTASTTYVPDTAVHVNFAVADASHRVIVTVTTIGTSDGTNRLFGSLAMDGATVGDLVSTLSNPAPMTLQYVFSPGDTSLHTYGLYQRVAGGAGGVINNSGVPTLLIEEII